MNNPKFQIKKSSNDQFYFVLKAKNGEIILTAGEMYVSKQGCEGSIASVQANASENARYEKKNGDGYYNFRLNAANGKVLGKSESYTSAASRDNGVEAVKRDAPGAPTEDLA